MKKIHYLMVLLGLLILSLPITSHSSDGTDLLKDCKIILKEYDKADLDGHVIGSDLKLSPEDIMRLGFTMGSINGVFKTTQKYGVLFSPKYSELKNCNFLNSKHIPLFQVMKVIVKYLENNPRNLHMNSDTLILLAIIENCQIQ